MNYLSIWHSFPLPPKPVITKMWELTWAVLSTGLFSCRKMIPLCWSNWSKSFTEQFFLHFSLLFKHLLDKILLDLTLESGLKIKKSILLGLFPSYGQNDLAYKLQWKSTRLVPEEFTSRTNPMKKEIKHIWIVPTFLWCT